MLFAIALLLFLFVLNGVFAMSELAMMTSRQSRLARAAAAGSRGAASAMDLARNPTRFLSTVQVGITLIGILSGAFGETALAGSLVPLLEQVPWLAPYAQPLAFVLIVTAITYCSLVIGELVPKRIALAYPEAVASAISRPIEMLSWFASIPVKVLSVSTDFVTRALRIRPRPEEEVSADDVKVLLARAAGTGIFTPQEHRLFQRIMRVGHLTARDLMVPRGEVIWIGEHDPVERVRLLVGTSPHSHFPVCRGSLDDLVGVVHIKDLIAFGLLTKESFAVATVAAKPLFVPESTAALRLLERFRAEGTHVAIVVNEYGGTQGLLTINDVTSAIVGDMVRRGDAPSPEMMRRADGSWLIDGRVALHELVVALGLPPEAEALLPNVSTTAGVLTAVLGHIPREGESAVWQGWKLEVVDMDGLRVDKVLATRATKDAAASDASP